MTKPISPKQASRPKRGSPAHRAHLKKLVVRRLNRELKKGLRNVKVPNDIAQDLADEIAAEFRALGWGVKVTDLHDNTVSDAGNRYRGPGVGGMCWRYDFSVEFRAGDKVEVDMIDRQAFPNGPFEGTVVQRRPDGKSYSVNAPAQGPGKPQAGPMWFAPRYLTKL